MIALGGDGRTTWRTGRSRFLLCGWMDGEGTHENRAGTDEKRFEYMKSIYESISFQSASYINVSKKRTRSVAGILPNTLEDQPLFANSRTISDPHQGSIFVQHSACAAWP